MSYEDEWIWWLEDACYRVGRGASLLQYPSEVSPEGWEQMEAGKASLEEFHKVTVFRDEWIEDSTGKAAQVGVARYPWVISRPQTKASASAL